MLHSIRLWKLNVHPGCLVRMGNESGPQYRREPVGAGEGVVNQKQVGLTRFPPCQLCVWARGLLPQPQ